MREFSHPITKWSKVRPTQSRITFEPRLKVPLNWLVERMAHWVTRPSNCISLIKHSIGICSISSQHIALKFWGFVGAFLNFVRRRSKPATPTTPRYFMTAWKVLPISDMHANSQELYLPLADNSSVTKDIGSVLCRHLRNLIIEFGSKKRQHL